jgi:hypothetical protein
VMHVDEEGNVYACLPPGSTSHSHRPSPPSLPEYADSAFPVGSRTQLRSLIKKTVSSLIVCHAPPGDQCSSILTRAIRNRRGGARRMPGRSLLAKAIQAFNLGEIREVLG